MGSSLQKIIMFVCKALWSWWQQEKVRCVCVCVCVLFLDCMYLPLPPFQVNHEKRARNHVSSWMPLMPNSSKVILLSDSEDSSLGSLFPFVVIPPPPSPPVLTGFQAAQRRFIRGLCRLVELYRDDPSAPVWVYLMDDDAFMHPPNMAYLVTQLDPTLPHYYAEMCGGLPSVPFACGGGGIFISFYNLHKAYRALQTCYLALVGPMGQYDVAVSHCFANAGIEGSGRPEFCSQPPLYYMPAGKGQAFNRTLFLRAVSYHYITKEYGLLFQKMIHEIPWWPSNTTLPSGVEPLIPSISATWPKKRDHLQSAVTVEFGAPTTLLEPPHVETEHTATQDAAPNVMVSKIMVDILKNPKLSEEQKQARLAELQLLWQNGSTSSENIQMLKDFRG